MRVALALALAGSIGCASPTPYEVVHFPSGPRTLGGELFRPKGKGPFPAVLYNHGSVEGMKSDMAAAAMGPRYAAKGWIFSCPIVAAKV